MASPTIVPRSFFDTHFPVKLHTGEGLADVSERWNEAIDAGAVLVIFSAEFISQIFFFGKNDRLVDKQKKGTTISIARGAPCTSPCRWRSGRYRHTSDYGQRYTFLHSPDGLRKLCLFFRPGEYIEIRSSLAEDGFDGAGSDK